MVDICSHLTVSCCFEGIWVWLCNVSFIFINKKIIILCVSLLPFEYVPLGYEVCGFIVVDDASRVSVWK